MKSAKGYTKESYTTRCEKSGGTVIHFESMKNAVEYSIPKEQNQRQKMQSEMTLTVIGLCLMMAVY